MLTKPQAKRLAVAAQDGLARAIRPVHTPLDGNTVFAVATGARALVDSVFTMAMLGALAADVMARAVARGVYMAASSIGLDGMPEGPVRALNFHRKCNPCHSDQIVQHRRSPAAHGSY